MENDVSSENHNKHCENENCLREKILLWREFRESGEWRENIFCHFLRSFPTFPQYREGCAVSVSENLGIICKKKLIRQQKLTHQRWKYVKKWGEVRWCSKSKKSHGEKLENELKSWFESFHFSSLFTVHFSEKKKKKIFHSMCKCVRIVVV